MKLSAECVAIEQKEMKCYLYYKECKSAKTKKEKVLKNKTFLQLFLLAKILKCFCFALRVPQPASIFITREVFLAQTRPHQAQCEKDLELDCAEVSLVYLQCFFDKHGKKQVRALRIWLGLQSDKHDRSDRCD